MAYAFSNVEDLLNGQQATGPQANIFGDAAAQPYSNTAPQGENKLKTVDEGGTGGASTATNPDAGGGQQAPVIQDTRAGDKAAQQANIGKTAQPSAIQGVEGQLAANEKKLQDEANAYTTKQEANQQYAVGNDVMDNAVNKGNVDPAWSTVSGLIRRPTINTFDDFVAPDVNVADVGLFKTNAGLKNLVSRGQDPNYSGGMAAFDVRSLQGTPGFQDTVHGILARSDVLLKDADSRGEILKTGVAEYGQKNLAEAQAAAKAYLGDRSTGLMSANEAEAKAYNDMLAGMDFSGAARDAKAKALVSARANMTQMNPYAFNFFNPDAVNESEYLRKGANLGASDFVSNDEANQYNNILQLLGNGGQSWSQSLAHPDAANNYTVDNSGLQKALSDNALLGFGQYRDKTIGEMQAIKDAAGRTADAEDARYLSVVNSQTTPWRMAQAQAAAKEAGLAFDSSMDLSPYAGSTASPMDLGWSNVLSQTDADKLNQLNATIGGNEMYNAGGYKANDPYQFDKAGYLGALTKSVADKKDKAAKDEADLVNQLKLAADSNDTGKLSILGRQVPIKWADTENEKAFLKYFIEPTSSPNNNVYSQAVNQTLAAFVPGYKEAQDKFNNAGGKLEATYNKATNSVGNAANRGARAVKKITGRW